MVAVPGHSSCAASEEYFIHIYSFLHRLQLPYRGLDRIDEDDFTLMIPLSPKFLFLSVHDLRTMNIVLNSY
jgi:hypothetical protein